MLCDLVIAVVHVPFLLMNMMDRKCIRVHPSAVYLIDQDGAVSCLVSCFDCDSVVAFVSIRMTVSKERLECFRHIFDFVVLVDGYLDCLRTASGSWTHYWLMRTLVVKMVAEDVYHLADMDCHVGGRDPLQGLYFGNSVHVS